MTEFEGKTAALLYDLAYIAVVLAQDYTGEAKREIRALTAEFLASEYPELAQRIRDFSEKYGSFDSSAHIKNVVATAVWEIYGDIYELTRAGAGKDT